MRKPKVTAYEKLHGVSIEEDLQMSNECLDMVAARLDLHGCKCSPPGRSGHRETPPMSYDDWVSCAVHYARREGFKAGQEAMRERCATQAAEGVRYWRLLGDGAPQAEGCQSVEQVIRALPVEASEASTQQEGKA